MDVEVRTTKRKTLINENGIGFQLKRFAPVLDNFIVSVYGK